MPRQETVLGVLPGAPEIVRSRRGARRHFPKVFGAVIIKVAEIEPCSTEPHRPLCWADRRTGHDPWRATTAEDIAGRTRKYQRQPPSPDPPKARHGHDTYNITESRRRDD